MPVFVLKKYVPDSEVKDQKDDPAATAAVPKEEPTIKVGATDSIGKVVAQALYKAMPNLEITRSEDEEDPQAKAVSTEQINECPATALQSLGKNTQCVLIINNGFKTSEEEWFLQTLETRQIRPFYTVNSFVRYVQSVLG